MAFQTTPATRASFSIFSIIAIICAVPSFASSGGLGLILAIVVIITGAVGALMAFLPSRRGGECCLLTELRHHDHGFLVAGDAAACGEQRAVTRIMIDLVLARQPDRLIGGLKGE